MGVGLFFNLRTHEVHADLAAALGLHARHAQVEAEVDHLGHDVGDSVRALDLLAVEAGLGELQVIW